MTGHESGIDLRRDDGTLDVELKWIARNGEVHFTIEVYGQYGNAKTIVDITADQAHEIAGAFREAAQQAGEPYQWATKVVPASVAEARRNALAKMANQGVHVLGERD